MYYVWDAVCSDKTKNSFIFDKKTLSSFDASLNTHSPVNKTVDAFYLIARNMCYNSVCVKCVKEDQFYKHKCPISNYFVS